MISLIVCSVDAFRFEQFRKNVQQTIGVSHEIIRLDNQQNQYSICSAYNEGTRRAKGTIYCFAHEDILFQTKNWGQILCDIFKKETIGMVGVAGATYYPLPPIGWFSTNEAEVNIVQHFNHSTNDIRKLTITRHPHKSRTEGVVADGVFMAIPARLFTQISFNETVLKGFHGYDVDISLQIGKHYKILLTKEIVLEHFSEGQKDRYWHEAMQIISDQWKDDLPRMTTDYTQAEKKEINIQALDVYFRNRLKNRISFWKRTAMTFKYGMQQGILWDTMKIILRYYLLKKKA